MASRLIIVGFVGWLSVLWLVYTVVVLPICRLIPSSASDRIKTEYARLFWNATGLVEGTRLHITAHGDPIDINESTLVICMHVFTHL
jgi:hypothetical protein